MTGSPLHSATELDYARRLQVNLLDDGIDRRKRAAYQSAVDELAATRINGRPGHRRVSPTPARHRESETRASRPLESGAASLDRARIPETDPNRDENRRLARARSH